MNTDSTARTDNVENHGDIGSITTIVVANPAESHDATDSEEGMTIRMNLSIVQSAGPVH